MDDPQAAIPKIAMAEYTLDLGVPIVNFLLRLKLADSDDEARQLIASSRFYLNDECFNDPDTVITSKLIKGWTLVKAGERQVWVTSWSDDNGLR
jgi:tyrosyl-tRNA synthetase